MRQRRFLLAACIIAVAIVGGFVVSVPHTTREVIEPTTKEAPVATPEVALKDVYKKGVHTLSGSLLVPTACTSLEAKAHVSDGIITVELTTTPDTDVCLMVPTKTTFVATTTAASGLPVLVTVDGHSATTTPL